MPLAALCLSFSWETCHERHLRWIDAIATNGGRAADLLRQPSISAQKIGLDECAALLRSQWVADGLENTRILPVPDAPSIVYATEPAATPGARTLLCYSHYDVQPPEPLELWVDPPFSAAIRDGIIYARGATDNKSGALAFVRAAQAFREVRGGPPVNLVHFCEGEEEVGSPHLAAWAADHAGLLQCDASIGLDGGVHRTSFKPEIHLGIKAILAVELRVKSHGIDFWSGRAQLLQARSASWRLVHCLSSIFSPEGRILIDGWYDDLLPPDADDLYWLRNELAHFDRKELARQLGVRGDFPYADDLELLKAIHYGASCNIAGLAAGYAGEGHEDHRAHRGGGQAGLPLPAQAGTQRADREAAGPSAQISASTMSRSSPTPCAATPTRRRSPRPSARQ